MSEMGEAENRSHPRETLSGTPTAQIGEREKIAKCAPYTVSVFI